MMHLFKSPPIIPGSTDQVRYETWTENANLTVTFLQEHREHMWKSVSEKAMPILETHSIKIPPSSQSTIPDLKKEKEKDSYFPQ